MVLSLFFDWSICSYLWLCKWRRESKKLVLKIITHLRKGFKYWNYLRGRVLIFAAKSWTWPSDFTFTFHFHALEKEMATHSSVLAWRIPGTGEPGRLPPMGLHRVGHDWSNIAAAADNKKSLLLLLLLLSRFSHVRPCATPETAAHQAPHPWDSPGKNTGVGCHFVLQCMKMKSESEVTQSCLPPSDPMDCSPPGSSIHGIFQARVFNSDFILTHCWAIIREKWIRNYSSSGEIW